MLLSLGARPTAKTATAGTPLALAVVGGHGDVVEILKRYGADGGEGDGDGPRGPNCDFDRGCCLS